LSVAPTEIELIAVSTQNQADKDIVEGRHSVTENLEIGIVIILFYGKSVKIGFQLLLSSNAPRLWLCRPRQKSTFLEK